MTGRGRKGKSLVGSIFSIFCPFLAELTRAFQCAKYQNVTLLFLLRSHEMTMPISDSLLYCKYPFSCNQQIYPAFETVKIGVAFVRLSIQSSVK